ncbi:septal ring lytic transglycosylase RlpA family protein [Erythrobacter sp. F6033]|uniref:septal ring lytic transglycosylase RlpA family protein n=1 Tax=Erythrobacter sp. F6033 TaxID=2926401 RepID=UPI001FF24BF6|nr:septal ring lytic transglycosylase RlpA family protein [Erythrobacter sp. F6033]MCK0128056.1 septal ring lytic transglycosylase RlpA family protein [Erythrobacter sp. F6033]
MRVGKRYAALRATAPIAALFCVSSVASGQDQPDQTAPATNPLVATYPKAKPPFVDTFEPFATPKPDLNLPASAVDITTFEAPLEPRETVRSLGTGVASYYGRRFHGRRTANGERFNMNAMTAAHKTLPFGTKVRVTNARNGRSVVVRINDRGPFIRGRTIDLSRGAATKIGMIGAGHAQVKLDIID